MVSRARLSYIWSLLSENYWTVPATMLMGAVGLSFLLPWVDHLVGDTGSLVPDWLYGAGPAGARLLLSTIAGSMITVAALTFSITIVGLSTASQQFGPRLIRSFIADRGYQVVLGTFLSIFIYSLLVLRTVRDDGSTRFVPYISVTVGVVFALAGAFVLIYFIHHAATSLRAEKLVATIGRELRSAIEGVFPEGADGSTKAEDEYEGLSARFPEGPRIVTAHDSGYLQAIDEAGLADLAQEHDVILRLDHRLGHFVGRETPLVEVWTQGELSGEIQEGIAESFVFGAERSVRRSVESSIDQLVEIAVRALSPGINDPDTALLCIDQLLDAVGVAGERRIPPSLIRRDGKIRLVTYPLDFEHLVNACFNSIRQYGRGSVPVALRLLEGLASLGSRMHSASQRTVLLRQATMIWRGNQEAIPEPDDLRLVEDRFGVAERALAGAEGPGQRGAATVGNQRTP